MRRLTILAPVVCGSYLVQAKPPPYNERIRGLYENKIRQFAKPEKVFETFASKREGKSFFMSPEDLFKSFTPYNYSPNKDMDQLFTSHESQTIKLIDANGDGKISFAEYVFLFVILGGNRYTVNNKVVQGLFQEYGGVVKRKQFSEIMNKARLKTSFGAELVANWSLPDPRGAHITEEEFLLNTKQLIGLLFHQKSGITYEDFIELKDLITEELLYYEFNCFEVDEQDRISSDSFARSIVSYLHSSDVEKFLRRIDHLDLPGNVSFTEFVAFQRIMDDVEFLEMRLIRETALKGMSLSKQDILRIFRECEASNPFCQQHNLHVSETQVDVFVRVLDLNGNGFLEPEEFFSVLYSKATFGAQQLNKPHVDDVTELLKRLANIFCDFLGYEPYFQIESQMTKVLQRISRSKT